MEKISVMLEVADDSEFALYPTLTELRSKLASVVDRGDVKASALASLPAEKKAMYEHLFALIYECSSNRVAAKVSSTASS
jgi:hypothetical protein